MQTACTMTCNYHVVGRKEEMENLILHDISVEYHALMEKARSAGNSIDTVIDGLMELLNGGSFEAVSKSVDKLFSVRDALYGIADEAKHSVPFDMEVVIKCSCCVHSGSYDDCAYKILRDSGSLNINVVNTEEKKEEET